MLERKLCPGGHGSPGAQKICLSCGHLFASQAGEQLQDLQVLEGFSWMERNVYLAQGEGRRYTVVEILDYFVPEVRQQLFDKIQPLLESLEMPLLSWQSAEEDGLPVLYSYYPAELWPVLQENVQTRLETAGLLPASEVAKISLFLQRIVNGLGQQKLVNPGLILPLLFCGQGKLALLEWEHIVPADDSLIYPRYYIGFHPLGASHNVNQHYANAALSATLIQLLCGKRPALWYPQPIDWAPYRSMLQPDAIRLLESAREGKLIPAVAQRLYQPKIAETVAEANRLFNQGQQAWQAGDIAAALGPFQSAAFVYFNCPQILRFLALSAARQGDFELALQAIYQALDIQELACIYADLGHIHSRQDKPELAASALHQALDVFSLYPEAWFQLARQYFELRRPDQAEKAYKKAWELRKSPEHGKALYLFYQNQNLPHEAERYAQWNLNSGAVFQARLQTLTSLPLKAEAVWLVCPECNFANDEKTVQCQRCQRPLHYQAGDNINDYQIIGIVRLKDYDNSRFANLYLARHASGPCLIKEMILSHAQEWMFHREAKVMSTFSHPNLVPLLESFQIEDKGYLVYRHFEGQTLLEKIQLDSCIDEALALKIAITMGQVLLAMQAQKPILVHGDIKPSNILLAQNGNIYLLDFESSRHISAEKGVATVVSEGISAPEQQLMFHLNSSSDSYALARTLIQAITGLSPYLSQEHVNGPGSGRWHRFAWHLHAEFRLFLDDCTPIDPNARLQPQQAEFAQRLQQLAALTPFPTPAKTLEMAHLMQDIALCQDPVEAFKMSFKLLEQESSTLTLALAAAVGIAAQAYRKAYGILTRLIRVDRHYVQAAWLLADCCQRLNQPHEAIRALKLSLVNVPNLYQTYLLLGDLYMVVQEPLTAMKLFEHAKSLRPVLCEVDYKLAKLYAAAGFYDKAISHCQTCLTIEQPVHYKVLLLHTLGACFGKKGLFQSALEPLEKAFGYLPNQPDVLYDLALTHYAMKNYERTLGLLQMRLRQDPGHAPSLYHLALSAIELKQGQIAVDSLKKMAPKAFNEAEYFFHLARAYTLVSAVPDAVRCYQYAHALLPDSSAILVNLANLYVIMEQPEQARQVLTKALQLNPGLKEAQHTLELLQAS